MIEIFPVLGLPEIRPGDDLAALTAAALESAGQTLRDGDVVVITSKAVSKAEGRILDLDEVSPSAFAIAWAAGHGRDPRQVEVVLGEARRIVRMDRGLIVAETRHGLVCANAGVDASNAAVPGQVILLPLDPDASARALRDGLCRRTGVEVAVVLSDTFGRPWRVGQTNVAIGCAGMSPLRPYAGALDPAGHRLVATTIAVADELAGAAELVMGKLDRVPVAVVRGFAYVPVPAGEPDPGAGALVRQAEHDLFR